MAREGSFPRMQVFPNAQRMDLTSPSHEGLALMCTDSGKDRISLPASQAPGEPQKQFQMEAHSGDVPSQTLLTFHFLLHSECPLAGERHLGFQLEPMYGTKRGQ